MKLDKYFFFTDKKKEAKNTRKKPSEFKMIKNKLEKLSNYFECEYSNFFDTDILISDHSSTMVEYAATGKSIIYRASSVELNI